MAETGREEFSQGLKPDFASLEMSELKLRPLRCIYEMTARRRWAGPVRVRPAHRNYGRTEATALTLDVSLNRAKSKSIMSPCFDKQSERAAKLAPSEASVSPDGVSHASADAVAKREATGPDLASGRTKTNT